MQRVMDITALRALVPFLLLSGIGVAIQPDIDLTVIRTAVDLGIVLGGTYAIGKMMLKDVRRIFERLDDLDKWKNSHDKIHEAQLVINTRLEEANRLTRFRLNRLESDNGREHGPKHD